MEEEKEPLQDCFLNMQTDKFNSRPFEDNTNTENSKVAAENGITKINGASLFGGKTENALKKPKTKKKVIKRI